jgi:rod shape determining protein RodA
MKLTVVIALTKYFSNDEMDGRYNLRSLVPPFLIVLIPLLMISRQPDLGTALFLVIIFFSFVMFVGIRKNSFIILATTGMVLVPLGWFFLKDYQKERVLTFLNPERDPLGAGYHTIQSIIAVGSGGGFGKGIFRGTQSQLRFLPEQKTDFAFSVFAEEWGFLGTFLLILMFFVLVLWGIKIAKNSKDLPGMLLAYGVTMYILWGVLINIGMVIGILPVVGIPLPFISYGGSSMIILMMGVGLLMNVSMRKFMLQS